jgi:cobalt-zinc-cadmium efflux system membrane fusion protein
MTTRTTTTMPTTTTRRTRTTLATMTMSTEPGWPRRLAAAASLSVALIAGCGGGADPGAAAPAPAPVVVTHYTDQAELFVEFPPLVAGQASTFLAHFTRLADFSPVTAGVLEVQLTGGQAPPERFRVRAPTRDGLFTPAVAPRAVGERQLSLVLESPGLSSRHELGSIMVFADAAAAATAPPAAAAADGDIGFLKEQQWQPPFAHEAAQLGTLRESVAAPATVRAAGDGEFAIAAVAPGRVIGTAAGFPVLGQAVAQGDVLAILVPRLGTGTDVGALDAELTQARQAAALARADRERMESLFADEAVAERRVAESRAAERIAQAQLQAAQQRNAAYRAGGAGAGIAVQAPMAGMLAQVHVGQGATVAEGDALFHIVDPATLWLAADVADIDAARLRTPTGAEFDLPGADQTVRIEVGGNGELVGVGAVIDPIARTVPVIFALRQPPPALMLNQRVDARIFTGATRDALSVPASAVIEDGGERVVYVQRGGEAFARVPVSLGSRDGDRYEILAGLAPGDRVVTQGAMRIRLAAASPEAMGHGHAH